MLALPILFFVKSKPPTPPSASAAKLSNVRTEPFLRSVIKLFTNINYIILLIAFAFLYNVYTSLGAIVGPLVESFGYDQTATSIFGVVYIGSGLFGSFAHAIILDRYKKYKLQLVILCVGATCACGVVLLVLDYEIVPLTAATLFLLGINVLPALGVGYSTGCVITYPLGESLTCGVLQMFSSIISFLYRLAMTALLDIKNWYAIYLLVASPAIAIIFALIIRVTGKFNDE